MGEGKCGMRNAECGMKLVANKCVNCSRVMGYLTPQALEIPSLCVVCAGDDAVMRVWGHTIDKQERQPKVELLDLRRDLNRMKL